MITRKKQCGHLRCGATCRFGPKQKKIYRIPKVAGKRKVDDEKYFSLREVFLKDHPRCECGRPGCNRKSVDIHHTKGRGIYYLDITTWKAVARVCHIWAGNNPKEAIEIGLSHSRIT